MINFRSTCRARIGAGIALITACALQGQALANGHEPPSLFGEVVSQQALTHGPILTIRSRAVRVRFESLEQLGAGDGGTINLNLFDDARWAAAVDLMDRRTPDRWTASGRLVDDTDGRFVLAVEGEWIAGAVWSTGGTFVIRSAGEPGEILIEQIDPERFGGCACTTDHGRAAAEDKDNAPGLADEDAIAAGTCDQSIDVLVVYTPKAKTSVGGDTAIRALVNASLASANIAYADSDVKARFRLVHVQEVNYAESNSVVTDLTRLQVTNDGFLDEVHALRNQYGADLVSLIVDSFDSSCGVAFVMTSPSPAFAPTALSVIQQNCALGNLSFGHELAHNLGCQHDWADPSPGAFPYSHGLKFIGLSGRPWRTMMAGTPGSRIPHFSNPNVLFDGVATGIPEGQPNPADNARTINNTAAIAGAFRSAVMIDCNGNGVSDACDILAGTSADLNENGVPDECDGPPCADAAIVKITAADAISFDRLGVSVSMSDDRAVAGANLDDDLGVDSGSAYVYRDVGGQWMQEAKLHASDGVAFQYFGRSVAISADGNFILVGAFRDGFVLSDVGAAYIFRWNGTNWVQEAKLANPDPAQSDWFGWSVAWAGADESNLVAVIGAVFDDEAANDAGASYVYARTESGWGPPVKLMALDAQAGDRLGYAVAGSLDGERVIAGAPLADPGAANAGAAYVFRREGDAWSADGKLAPTDPNADARFGYAVAIDGGTALVGAINDGEVGYLAGAAYAFRRQAAWVQEAKILSADAAAERQFGAAVSVRGDRAVVGSILDVVRGAAAGAAYVFDRSGGRWLQRGKISPADGAAYDNFGVSVAIAPGGGRAVAGAYFDDHHDVIDGGSVSVFSLTEPQTDCNGNGIADACDISSGMSSDVNGNGVPDECENLRCPADVFGPDGEVDVRDLLRVINHWGPCPSPCAAATCPADIDADCVVGVTDLMEVIRHWGACP